MSHDLAVANLNAEGRIVSSTTALSGLTGHAPRVLKQMDLYDLVFSPDRELIRSDISALKSGSTAYYRTTFRVATRHGHSDPMQARFLAVGGLKVKNLIVSFRAADAEESKKFGVGGLFEALDRLPLCLWVDRPMRLGETPFANAESRRRFAGLPDPEGSLETIFCRLGASRESIRRILSLPHDGQESLAPVASATLDLRFPWQVTMTVMVRKNEPFRIFMLSRAGDAGILGPEFLDLLNLIFAAPEAGSMAAISKGIVHEINNLLTVIGIKAYKAEAFVARSGRETRDVLAAFDEIKANVRRISLLSHHLGCMSGSVLRYGDKDLSLDNGPQVSKLIVDGQEDEELHEKALP